MNNKKNKHMVESRYVAGAKAILFEGMAEELLPTIPEAAVHLVVASPPYNVGKEYEDSKSIELYLAEQDEIINHLVRIVNPRGSICWQVGNFVKNGEVFPLDIFYYHLFKNKGLILRNRIIWRYGHGLHAKNRFSGRYETILWFTKSQEYTFNLDKVRVRSKYPGKMHAKGDKKGEPSGNPKGKNPSDYWELIANEWNQGFMDIPNVKANHVEKTSHPCQFPVELVERCVLALTNENDLVLDPYLGVGSTIIGALKHKRRAIGSEKESEYIEIARERVLKLLDGELRTRSLGQPVYKPKPTEKVAQVPDEWKGNANSIYSQQEQE